MLPRPHVQSTLRTFEASRQRPAVRLVELATRAAEEEPKTVRLVRRVPQPTFSVAAGGCRTCGHLVRVHESGFQGRRVPCKSLGCDCARYRGPRITFEVAVTALIVAGLLLWVLASLAART